MWCKTSIALTIVVVWCTVVSLVIAASPECDNSRPPRPPSFNSPSDLRKYVTELCDNSKPPRPPSFNSPIDLQKYVTELKAYYRPKTGGRYGKRSYEIPAVWRNYFMLQNRMY